MLRALRWSVGVGASLLFLATPSVGQAPRLSAAERARLERRAKAVTIYRDTYGVPHVHGKTDPDAVFGMSYAYAEDRFPEMEPYFYRALGRAAEVEGESGVRSDIILKAVEVERLAHEEYAHEEPRIRALAGISDGAITAHGYPQPASARGST